MIAPKAFKTKGCFNAYGQLKLERGSERMGKAEYCVTGGTGLVASHLIKALLGKGYTVRATVRDPENVGKVGFLWKMDGAKERLRLYKADLMVDGSFDQVIQGVDGVFHVACPVLSPCQGDDDIQAMIIDPCVKGTINVLNSCSKTSTVKRIVLTSSSYAITQRDDIQQISPVNESHWSDLDYCKRHNMWYAYGKTIAEKMAWQVAEDRGLDLVAVHPTFVVGPLLSPEPSSTLKYVFDQIKGKHGGYRTRYVGLVHVEDAVAAHILAMEDNRVSGRLICSCLVAYWPDIIAMLKAKYPEYPFETKPISMEVDHKEHSMDTSKLMKLGFPGFKSVPQMFDDCVASFQQKGLL